MNYKNNALRDLQAFAKAVVELNSPDQLLATRRIAEAYGFKL
jgi:hypothetical protein